jgi:hypothetical protein
MMKEQLPPLQSAVTRPTDDPVMTELWQVKDRRAEQFVDAAGLIKHLHDRYGRNLPTKH